MKNHFLKSYNVEEKKINIVPCGIDETDFFFNEKIRDMMRKEIGSRNRLVFVYSGSMHPLQMPRAIVKLFREFYKLDKEVFFLILTFKVEKARRLLECELIPQENYKALAVEYSKIPMYLNAADIGILLREKNIVNRVACPTKFAEYVACGLYTILTDEIGDISGMVERERIGEVIKSSLKESEIKSVVNEILIKRAEILKNRNKERIAQFARTKYSWTNLMPIFWKTYEDLFKKRDFR
jgi:glycosyltransferase involved in cell wall biosynthesis